MNKANIALLNKHTDILSFRDMSDSTVRNYTHYLTCYINWVEENLPDRELSSITWDEMRLYINYLKKDKKLNNRTINGHISQMHDFYEYVLHRVWDHRGIPTLRFTEKQPNVPTREEVFSIINSIKNPKHKAWIALMYSSGMRISELCQLRCGDIHMSDMTVFIAKAVFDMPSAFICIMPARIFWP
ncbi:MAG: tyrosine-type recombinase/integrase [Candidatus Weimeria sp.]